MGLRGERRLAERRSAVRMPSQKEHQHASKTMKLIPQIDGDETMKCYMVLFLAGGEWIMWLPIWASLICLGQRNRQVIQCSVANTPGYSAVILFAYSKPHIELLTFTVCLSPIQSCTPYYPFWRWPGITWIYNFQPWQAKGIVIQALRWSVRAAEWVFSLTDSLEAGLVQVHI